MFPCDEAILVHHTKGVKLGRKQVKADLGMDFQARGGMKGQVEMKMGATMRRRAVEKKRRRFETINPGAKEIMSMSPQGL